MKWTKMWTQNNSQHSQEFIVKHVFTEPYKIDFINSVIPTIIEEIELWKHIV